MNENELSWAKRDYGYVAHGVIEAEDRNIDVTLRRPSLFVEESGFCIVMENGWTAGKNSMRVPAIEAAYAGHVAVTFEYTNVSGKDGALEENVDDVTAITKAFGNRYRMGLMGLSMGGAVATLAIESLLKDRDAEGKKKTTPRIELANIVAPGKYILPHYINKRIITQRFLAETQEVTEMSANPLQAMRIGFTSMMNCLKRPFAVSAELRELTTGTVHDNLRFSKEHPEAPYIRLALPVNDKLLCYDAQKPSVEGLPFDEVIDIPGGHGGLAYRHDISRNIFDLDRLVIPTLSQIMAVDKTKVAA
jgi:hypothetical protein